MKKIAISIGDLNGIGIALALQNHHVVKEFITPMYIIDKEMLSLASELLKLKIPDDFECVEYVSQRFKIMPSTISKESGRYAFESFKIAVELAKDGKVDGIMTLPIHKKAWEMAGINYKGHTDALRDFFDSEAIMMLGCEKMFVALYTEHIPLSQVALEARDALKFGRFLENFYQSIKDKLQIHESIAVLALNPHAGDYGVLGDEEKILNSVIDNFNLKYQKKIFSNAIVPDIAFSQKNRDKYRFFIAMYHDQGLIPLKALYFEESINISLHLPILRTSVDHGTAFDIAYTDTLPNNLSYLNALKYYL
ncbi:MAG: 4-hydroxythreonine-4-phosphate dehydrogenase [Epsilonproteobacteria bacterium]|nr:4-hydroxythreonine-4-phosphate dehydrogenase [Campylobacterota bacterium]MBD3839046.1 4-hydroxythreonine-4-phosphate dehydrogenase [Campylobacterota bacterium]